MKSAPSPHTVNQRGSPVWLRSFAAGCSARISLTLPLLALALLAPVRSETEPATLTVYHAFATDRSGQWASVSVADDPAAWHVGGPDGPVASRAQLDAVFASLGWVVVGATCPSVSEGSTHYPCGFELAAPVNATRPGALRMDRPWASISGDLLTQYERPNAPASLTAYSDPNPSTDAAEQRIVSMLAADRSFVGLYSQHAFSNAAARTLSFRFRMHANRISTPRADTSRGLLILSTHKPSSTDLQGRSVPRQGTKI
jgi:hypothetical protein